MKGVLSAVALIAEDLRQDANGLAIITGVLQDNVQLQEVPSALARIGFYCRVHIDTRVDSGPLTIFVRRPDGGEEGHNHIDHNLMIKARSDAADAGKPYAGIVAQLTASPYMVPVVGLWTVMLRSETEEMPMGLMNFSLAPQLTAS